jgi:hypothetical protein
MTDLIIKAVQKIERIAQAHQDKRLEIWEEIKADPDPTLLNLLEELKTFGKHKAVSIETKKGTWKTGKFDPVRDLSIKVQHHPRWRK